MKLPSPLLVLDVHYLCHRAFHASASFSGRDRAKGVLVGFLRTVSLLSEQFQTDRFVFCFEHSHLFRRDTLPTYKSHPYQKKRTPQEEQDYRRLGASIADLQYRFLPEVGFRNVFCSYGMEADDLIAALVEALPDEDEAVLITADKDLYQCLRPNVRIFCPTPGKMITEMWFRREYGILPAEWADMKALAGCSSDTVPGVRGVGELTALRYLRDELKPRSKAWRSINSKEGQKIRNRNFNLVSLPHYRCPIPKLLSDSVSGSSWRRLCLRLGARDLVGRPPLLLRRLPRT